MKAVVRVGKMLQTFIQLPYKAISNQVDTETKLPDHVELSSGQCSLPLGDTGRAGGLRVAWELLREKGCRGRRSGGLRLMLRSDVSETLDQGDAHTLRVVIRSEDLRRVEGATGSDMERASLDGTYHTFGTVIDEREFEQLSDRSCSVNEGPLVMRRNLIETSPCFSGLLPIWDMPQSLQIPSLSFITRSNFAISKPASMTRAAIQRDGTTFVPTVTQSTAHAGVR